MCDGKKLREGNLKKMFEFLALTVGIFLATSAYFQLELTHRCLVIAVDIRDATLPIFSVAL